MPSYRYRLIDHDGNDLGPLLAGHIDWQPGELIPPRDGDLRVTAVVEPDPDTQHNFQGYLVVERVDP